MSDKIFIIIVTWNGQKFIRECLSSIYNQNTQDFEVLIIDNNSSDKTVEIIENEFKDVHLFKNTDNNGFGAGNNQAIKKALSMGADYVVL